MSEVSFTPEDMNEFTQLVILGESHDQMSRITSRLEFPAFIERVGRETCNAMFDILMEGEQ